MLNVLCIVFPLGVTRLNLVVTIQCIAHARRNIDRMTRLDTFVFGVVPLYLARNCFNRAFC